MLSRICPLLCKAVEIPDACDFGRRFQGFLSTFNKHRHFSLWFLCFNDSGLGKSFDWFMLNFVIREIWLKLCVTREFGYNLCMKRDHDPPPPPPPLPPSDIGSKSTWCHWLAVIANRNKALLIHRKGTHQKGPSKDVCAKSQNVILWCVRVSLARRFFFFFYNFRNTSTWWDPHGVSKPWSCLNKYSKTLKVKVFFSWPKGVVFGLSTICIIIEMKVGASEMLLQLAFDYRYSRSIKESLKRRCSKPYL